MESSSEKIMLKKGDIVYLKLEAPGTHVETIFQIRDIEGEKLFAGKSITRLGDHWVKTEKLTEITPSSYEKADYVRRHITVEEFDLIMNIYDK